MRQYQKLVYTVCLQFVHDHHTAEDLTQDTFLSAWASIDRCDPNYYKQWLVRVAANKCKDHLKSAWSRKVEAQSDETLPEPRGTPPPGSGLQAAEPDPQDELLRRTDQAELETMIRTLREPYGRAATMYLLEGIPVQTIARVLGRPAPTVQNQLFRAKAILRKQILERRQE
ncbi:MAG: sigma-70 family RNA polymerase sigma factor [Gemmiger sp.]|uniref:RNA polymerase sigma factor n=1 Tax=Gemmiger sp. TaxID=2049027 RepID=UPI002E78481A|nr:sigma-70 family RNA polymerase sigma factor [Gemmiger sp.]MEE0800118.1 sigma-70 family RNA polymerase sigma factor [Gemmiger sp.]